MGLTIAFLELVRWLGLSQAGNRKTKVHFGGPVPFGGGFTGSRKDEGPQEGHEANYPKKTRDLPPSLGKNILT